MMVTDRQKCERRTRAYDGWQKESMTKSCRDRRRPVGVQQADEESEQWQKWRGRWWMRIDQAELSSRQRRRISRVVSRWISRETSDIDCMVNELRQSTAEMRESAQIQRLTRYYNMSSGEEGHIRLHGHDEMKQDDNSW